MTLAAVEERREFEASVESRLDAARRQYNAALVDGNYSRTAVLSRIIEALEIEQTLWAIYSEEIGLEPGEETT